MRREGVTAREPVSGGARRTLLPVHWATFNLSYHDWEEPILRTLAAAQEAGVQLITPRPGETYEHGRPFASAAWYAAPPAR